jgi:dihydroorotase
VSLLHTRPAELFHITVDPTTKVVVDMGEYELSNEGLQTKCGWTPFAGKRVVGKVASVTLHDTLVYQNGKILVAPGSGRLIA